MTRIPSHDPDLVLYAWPGTWWQTLLHARLFHLLACGLLWLGAQPQGQWWVLWPCVVGLAVAGMARHGWDFNTRERTWRRWWAVLVPLRARAGSLGEFDRIVVKKTGSGGAFLVDLEGDDGRRETFGAQQRYEPARRQAEELAKALWLPLSDPMLGAAAVTGPEHLDEPLRDRVLRQRIELPDPGGPPRGARTRVEVSRDSLRLRVPGVRKRWAALLVSPLFAIGIFSPFLDGKERCALIGLSAIFFAILVYYSARRVDASPRELRVRPSIPGTARAIRIPSDELKDVFVEPPVLFTRPGRVREEILSAGCAVIVRGGRGSASLGRWLSRKEKDWLCALLRRIVAA